MAFTYHQKSGLLEHNGIALGMGYSGHDDGVNNPAMQNIRDIGPIPCGKYTIRGAVTHPHLGPVAMELLPYSTNQMFLRSEFFIHGDNSAGNRSASHGCIIMDRKVRGSIAAAVEGGENKLEVVA